MNYKLILCDIDGTLRPGRSLVIPEENVKALQAIQKCGVKVAIATGRAPGLVEHDLLNGLEPDFWMYSAGAVIEDKAGKILCDERFSARQVEMLLSFFADLPYPITLAFEEGNYVYQHYQTLMKSFRMPDAEKFFFDEEAKKARHLTSLPYAGFAFCRRQVAEDFAKAFPDSGLKFFFYPFEEGDVMGCDIFRDRQDKAYGLETLAAYLGFTPEECAAIGDGSNDVGMLLRAGLSYAMETGEDCAKVAAKRITPAGAPFGVAAACREIWPEAF